MGFKPMTFRTFFFPDISYKKTPNSILQYSGRTFSDPDGIQTHDLQNRNLNTKTFHNTCVHKPLHVSPKLQLRQFFCNACKRLAFTSVFSVEILLLISA